VEAGDSRVKKKSKKLFSTATRSKLVANPQTSMPTLENLSGEGSENKSKEEKK
jgi:hypothetical protein